MTERGTKYMLSAILILGLAAGLPTGSTIATFSDAHDGEGTFTAVDNFGGGPPGGVTADAGGPYTVQEGNSLTLDASGSSTQQGNIQSYDWTLLSGPGGGWYFPSTPYATYNAPNDVQGSTQAVVELTVTTNQGQTATDTATITIQDTSGSNTVTTQSSGNTAPPGKQRGTRKTFGNTTG